MEPLWASDAGRNSNSGKFGGTFVGWFDNLEITVGKTTIDEFDEICKAIEKPIIKNVIFKDTRNKRKNKTENFYGTTLSGKIKNINGKYEGFTFSLKAISRRSDM